MRDVLPHPLVQLKKVLGVDTRRPCSVRVRREQNGEKRRTAADRDAVRELVERLGADKVRVVRRAHVDERLAQHSQSRRSKIRYYLLREAEQRTWAISLSFEWKTATR
mgnify:CR=1 FL=1